MSRSQVSTREGFPDLNKQGKRHNAYLLRTRSLPDVEASLSCSRTCVPYMFHTYIRTNVHENPHERARGAHALRYAPGHSSPRRGVTKRKLSHYKFAMGQSVRTFSFRAGGCGGAAPVKRWRPPEMIACVWRVGFPNSPSWAPLGVHQKRAERRNKKTSKRLRKPSFWHPSLTASNK